MRFFKILISVVMWVQLLCTSGYAQILAFDLSNSQIAINQLRTGGPGKDEIPALNNPAFVDADKANYLKDYDMVVGVVIGQEAKAYPVEILNWHEVINDVLNDQRISVTWCPLATSALVFKSKVEEYSLEFGVSGLLYKGNLVLYDRLTNGLWSQLQQQALTGSLSGKSLELISSDLMSWGEWKNRFPQTKVLSKHTGYNLDYGRDPYADYHSSDDVVFSNTALDERVGAKDRVLAVKVHGETKAYTQDFLDLQDFPFQDTVGQNQIIIQNKGPHSFLVIDELGAVIPSYKVYWGVWSSFYPNSMLDY